MQVSITRSTTDHGGNWPSTAFLIVACVAAISVLYSETIATAVEIWRTSETHQVSFLILPVALYFVWIRRGDLARLEPRPDIRFALLALPTGLLWYLGEIAQVNVLAQFAVVGLIQIAVIALIGTRAARLVLFPVLILSFLVPFGAFFTPLLIKVTTAVSVLALNLSGLATQADGNVFTAGAGDYTIIGDCAALDFLLGNAVIALVFANLMYLGLARRTCYVVATFFVAFLANIFRIVSVVLITEYSGGAIDLAIDHGPYGTWVFLVTVVLEMKIGLRFRDSGTRPGRAVGADLIVGKPETGRPASPVTCLLILAVAIAAPPLYANTVKQPLEARPAVALRMPSWLEPREAIAGAGSWEPRYTNSHAQLHGQTTVGGERVDWFVAYYRRQGPDAEMIATGNEVYGLTNWHYLERHSRSPSVGGRPLDVIETRLHDHEDGRRRVWHWYWIADRFVADPLRAKLLQAGTGLLGSEGPAAVLAVSTVETGDDARTEAALNEALRHVPDIERLLQNIENPDE